MVTVNDLTEILSYTIWDNGIKDYFLALLAFTISIIILKTFKYIIISKLKKMVEKTRTELDDLLIKIIDNVGWPFYVLVSLYIALQFITTPDIGKTGMRFVILVVAAYYAVKSVQTIIDFFTHRIILKKQEEEKEIDTSVIDLLSRIAKAVLWIGAVLLILSNMGYNVTTLIAGMGIGGIAIAIALQSILGDIFASFSIYFDKPFQIGDFIIFGNEMGVVKKVGIKSTRVQALQGQEIVISNKQLTETIVHNYKKMEQRRVVFSFGVKYETSAEKMKNIPLIVKDIIGKIKLARIDRVHFFKFGDFSLIFEVVYYVATGDYNRYMDVQQEINLAIMERFEQEGIEMAYPTQTIRIQAQSSVA
ncbi:MAG: mechanosensitive ion channel family protein [Candidatus Methanoperedens sp.]|nr:mechanosensitive ion channel family protein [Candidatus Methanoperedens sp.]